MVSQNIRITFARRLEPYNPVCMELEVAQSMTLKALKSKVRTSFIAHDIAFTCQWNLATIDGNKSKLFAEISCDRHEESLSNIGMKSGTTIYLGDGSGTEWLSASMAAGTSDSRGYSSIHVAKVAEEQYHNGRATSSSLSGQGMQFNHQCSGRGGVDNRGRGRGRGGGALAQRRPRETSCERRMFEDCFAARRWAAAGHYMGVDIDYPRSRRQMVHSRNADCYMGIDERYDFHSGRHKGYSRHSAVCMGEDVDMPYQSIFGDGQGYGRCNYGYEMYMRSQLSCKQDGRHRVRHGRELPELAYSDVSDYSFEVDESDDDFKL